jgi:5'-nucleotidase
LSDRVLERPLLLLTNDDGIRAAGLRALERALARLGEVWTVAPDAERSTTSHSVNLRRPLLVTPAGRRRFAVAGTPVDSVFVGMFGLLPRRPAVVVSGINYGPNLGTDTIYSGTVAAAREAALRGIPGVAVSLTEGRDYSAAARVAARLVARVLDAGPAARREGRGVLLNLNVPPRPKPGVRLTCLGRRVYPEDVAVRRGRNGRMHARIGGYPVRGDGTLGTDTRAIDDGYASLSVLTLDFTQHDARRRFRALLAALDGTRGAAKEVRR